MEIDRKEWKVTFYLNNEEQFYVEMQKHIDYHLMFVGYDKFDYRLLS